MLKNQASFSFDDLYILFGPQVLDIIPQNLLTTGVSIDTRNIEKDNIFIPLKGSKIDGHDKISEAFEKGASICLANKTWYDSNPELVKNHSIIPVRNTEKALSILANHHREKFTGHVIAVAGSNGKTTTKELIASVLESKFKVLKTYKNFNNQLGVPLMMFQLSEEYDVAVIEIATNSIGEIEYLSKVLEPSHGLVTNIGKEHLELLEDLDGVEIEETALYTYLRKNNGLSFINMDDERLAKYVDVLDKGFTYGQKNANVKATYEYDEQLYPTLKINYEKIRIEAKVKVASYPGVINSLAAAAVGIALHLTPEQIKQGLENYQQKENESYGRMQIADKNGITILNDTYNANPSSTRMSLDTLKELKNEGSKIPVLGDMLELGERSIEEHREIYKYASTQFEKVYLTGVEFSEVHSELNHENVSHFSNKEKLSLEISKEIKKGDALLFKASRGIKLEEVIALLTHHI